MFKLFRLYQNYILAIGVTLLMCVFLVQGTLPSFFTPNPGTQVIGTINSQKITVADERAAEMDLQILKGLSPLLVLDERAGNDSALRWLLMVRDAKSQGLDTSDATVAKIEAELGFSNEEMERAQRARELGSSVAGIDRAVRDWDIVQQYKELVLGLGHLSADQRIERYQQAMMMAQIYGSQGSPAEINRMINSAIAGAQGTIRVSEPLLSHMLQEIFASVKISAAGVPADRYLPQVKSTPPEELTSLFDKYRNHLPGQADDEGYTFGYKTPDRVKIEYLAIPLNRLRETVKIDETEILTYYEKHKDDEELRPRTGATQPAAAPPTPDDETRAKIIDILTTQHATEMAQRAIKIAQAMLSGEVRSFKDNDGYRVALGWHPIFLEEVARQIQEQIGILPDVRRIGDRWLDVATLAKLPGIGRSFVDGTRGAPFTAYVVSAQEFSPKPDNSLAILHLQTQLPSQPLTGLDGSRFLFRLIAAEPARVPASIEETGVKTQVFHDAQRLAAYKLLLQDQESWKQKLQQHPLTSLAQEVGSPVLTPPPFPRRQLGPAGPIVPEVEGIGRDSGFVDQVFALAEKVALQGRVDAIPPAQRSRPIASNANLALYLVRIDAFEALSHSKFDQLAVNPNLGPFVQQVILAGKVTDTNTFSLSALEKRVGFVPTTPAKAEVESKPTPEAPEAPVGS